MRCTPTDTDLALLRRTFDLAGHAAARGIHPFAAILVGPEGEVLMEQINAYLPDLDMTGHAERVLMTRASTRWRPDFLARCTLYVSAEPCCMCAAPPTGPGWDGWCTGSPKNALKR